VSPAGCTSYLGRARLLFGMGHLDSHQVESDAIAYSGIGREASGRLRQLLHHRYELLSPIAVAASVVDKFFHLGDERPALGRCGHDDPPSPTELEKALFSQQPKGAQHGVRVHPEHGGEILGLRDALTGTSFTVGDRSPDVGSDLFV
jgi:hypothetical protein